MVYRHPEAAPLSQIPETRRGAVMGRFCLVCASIFPVHRGRHSGKPMYGKDHIAAPCAHEGEVFEPGAPWWEPAVEVLPPPPAPPTPPTPPIEVAAAPAPPPK